MVRPSARMSVAGALATALLVAACASGGGSVAPAGIEKPDLTIAAVPAFDSVGVYVAQQRGLFAAEGLHVTTVPVTSSSTAIAGELAGKYDLAVGAYPGFILADALHHADLRIIAPSSNMAPLGQQLVVPSGSPIHDATGLKGKRIGVNALNNIGVLLITSMLSDNGMSAGDVTFVPIPFPKMTAALRSGYVDAAWLIEPYITEAEESVGATTLADLNRGVTQGLPISGYSATQPWLDKSPTTAAAVRRALEKAQTIANDTRAAVQNGMVTYTGLPRQTVQIASLPDYPLHLNVNLLQRVANLMEQFGMTTQEFNVSQIVRG
jgi:NitT/TauT family transport system substrate-binding protein